MDEERKQVVSVLIRLQMDIADTIAVIDIPQPRAHPHTKAFFAGKKLGLRDAYEKIQWYIDSHSED